MPHYAFRLLDENYFYLYTLIIVSYKAQNQFDEQKLILASKYEDIRAKLKESQKLLKTSENKLQSLRSQISTKESDFTNLKENLKLKLQSMKKLNADYLLSIELIRTELSHIRKILNEELKTKYESYCDSLLVQKTADLRKRLYNEIEHRINKDKESAINNLTLAKQNEIDQLQQVNNELKRKMSKQRQEFENKITKTRNQLEEAINKEKSKLEEYQSACMEAEQKLIKEVALKENLEKQLVKSSNEVERIKKDYEILTKQAKESFL
ncbi:unnamed protein product [Heterobilharzia americana]|nr:unnamed protein product [Heterobilharzia americana]